MTTRRKATKATIDHDAGLSHAERAERLYDRAKAAGGRAIGWTWDATCGQYNDADGERITDAQLPVYRAAAEAYIAQGERALQEVAQAYLDEYISENL